MVPLALYRPALARRRVGMGQQPLAEPQAGPLLLELPGGVGGETSDGGVVERHVALHLRAASPAIIQHAAIVQKDHGPLYACSPSPPIRAAMISSIPGRAAASGALAEYLAMRDCGARPLPVCSNAR